MLAPVTITTLPERSGISLTEYFDLGGGKLSLANDHVAPMTVVVNSDSECGQYSSKFSRYFRG